MQNKNLFLRKNCKKDGDKNPILSYSFKPAYLRPTSSFISYDPFSSRYWSLPPGWSPLHFRRKHCFFLMGLGIDPMAWWSLELGTLGVCLQGGWLQGCFESLLEGSGDRVGYPCPTMMTRWVPWQCSMRTARPCH